MADCDWAILCDHAFPDLNRKMCLIGIFDRINTIAVPTALHQSALALKIVGDAQEKVPLVIRILRPTGGSLGDVALEATLSDTGTAEIQLGMSGLPLPDEGVYTFEITSGDASLKAIHIAVALQDRPRK